MVTIETAGITDVGSKREGNEDAFLLDDDLRLYIVADGMGGHQAGEVASEMVVETIQNHMQELHATRKTDGATSVDESLSREANHLLNSIQLANQKVYRASQTNKSQRGMGSTLSALYFINGTLAAANVGDSPIYLIHNRDIELLSVLHTVMAERAAVDPEGVKQLGRRFRHMLTRAMGINPAVEPDISEISCFKGDMFVISSDGLSDKVSPEEILGVVSKESPETACRVLVDLANERGGDDNITVIVIKVKSVRGERRSLKGLGLRIIGPILSLFQKR